MPETFRSPVEALLKIAEDFGYAEKDIAHMNLCIHELESLILSCIVGALPRNDPNWQKWDIDSKFPNQWDPIKKQRLQFCNHCGEPIIIEVKKDCGEHHTA
jgi:hypothetical protein